MELSHLDENNNPRMVDVSRKKETLRYAHATTEILPNQTVLEKFKDGEIKTKKGPVFQTAIVAGTMAVKKTSHIIPFCHPLNIEDTSLTILVESKKIVIHCKVKSFGKTGVEMEALMGVQAAALTIYDMCKSLGHDMIIDNCRLLEKTGGKSDF